MIKVTFWNNEEMVLTRNFDNEENAIDFAEKTSLTIKATDVTIGEEKYSLIWG